MEHNNRGALMNEQLINALWINASILLGTTGGFFAGMAYGKRNCTCNGNAYQNAPHICAKCRKEKVKK